MEGEKEQVYGNRGGGGWGWLAEDWSIASRNRFGASLQAQKGK